MYRTRLDGYASGFTLIELMVTIAVVAILAAIAFPSFKSVMQSNNVATATNELVASISLARSEAVRSNLGAGICPSTDGAGCSGAWSDGWIVWTDTNGSGGFNAGDTVVRYSQAREKTTLTGNAATIAFDARGRAATGQRTIELKPSDGTTPLRCLTMNATGQVTVSKQACS